MERALLFTYAVLLFGNASLAMLFGGLLRRSRRKWLWLSAFLLNCVSALLMLYALVTWQ